MLFRSMVVLPGALMLGATFAALERSWLATGGTTGGAGTRHVGAVYGLNALGAMAGAALGLAWMQPTMGLDGTIRASAIASLASGIMGWWAGFRGETPAAAAEGAPAASTLATNCAPTSLKYETERALMAFGGGGPLHAVDVARLLGIRRVLVTPVSGVFSAAGMLAAIMMAVAPTMVFTTGLLYPTTLYMLLLASMTLVAWDLGEQPQLGRGLALGALFALGWLTDQVFIAPSAAIALWLLWRLRQHGMALARALAAAVIMAAILAYPYALALERQTSDGVFMRKAQSVLFSARTDPVLSHERWITYPPGATFEALDRKSTRLNSSHSSVSRMPSSA